MNRVAALAMRARIALWLLIPAILVGCVHSGDELLEDQVEVHGSFGVDIQGRPFLFQILEAATDEGGTDHILQIDGDGIVVSFHSSTPPYVPVIGGEVVSFGGHDFEVTAMPNEFEIDGQPLSLPAPGIYIVSDGAFYGEYQSR